MKKDYPVFGRKLANLLIADGAELARVAPNKFKEGKVVFFFKHTTKLDELLAKHSKRS